MKIVTENNGKIRDLIANHSINPGDIINIQNNTNISFYNKDTDLSSNNNITIHIKNNKEEENDFNTITYIKNVLNNLSNNIQELTIVSSLKNLNTPKLRNILEWLSKDMKIKINICNLHKENLWSRIIGSRSPNINPLTYNKIMTIKCLDSDNINTIIKEMKNSINTDKGGVKILKKVIITSLKIHLRTNSKIN